jgi:hypothetical protein
VDLYKTVLAEVFAEEIANGTLEFEYGLISLRLWQRSCSSVGATKHPRSDTYSKIDDTVIQTGVEKHTLELDFSRIRFVFRTIGILYCKRKSRVEPRYQVQL